MADNKQDNNSPALTAAAPSNAATDKPSANASANATTAKPETKTDSKPDNKADTANKPHPHKTRHRQSHKGGGLSATLAVLALLTAGGAGGGVYWLWKQIDVQLQTQNRIAANTVNDIRDEMENLRSEIISSQHTLENQASESVTQAVEKLMAATSRQERNEQAQEALQASLEGLYARIGNTSRGWMVREADYLLQIANHRLQLEHDLDTAVEALRLADSRLGAIGEPALLNVRAAIAAEITALQMYPAPDRVAMSLALEELANKVETLPLKGKLHPEEMLSERKSEGSLADSWENLPTAVWEAMKQLVVVRVNDKPLEPLMQPEKVSFLYQNLQLKLEQARLALLQYDTELFRGNVQASQLWIRSYFNDQMPEVQNAVTTLQTMATAELAPPLPDISGSLRMLRNVASRLKLDNGKKVSQRAEVSATVAASEGGAQ